MRLLILILVIAAAAICIWYQDQILLWILRSSTDLNRVYSAVFGWSSIQTAFMFSVYGYITGSSSKFLKAIRGTSAIRQFHTDVWKALFAGFTLTFTSLALIIVGVEPVKIGIFFYIIVTWLLFFFWALLLFLQVAYDFGVVIRTKDHDETPASK